MNKKLSKEIKDMETGFHVSIGDHITTIRPQDYGISDMPVMDPSAYFVTSGDAVCKATVLDKDMWQAAGRAQRLYGKSKRKKHQEFVKKVWEMAGSCRKFVNFLKGLRGDAIFLETEHRDHKLYVIPKNPRKKDLID